MFGLFDIPSLVVSLALKNPLTGYGVKTVVSTNRVLNNSADYAVRSIKAPFSDNPPVTLNSVDVLPN